MISLITHFRLCFSDLLCSLLPFSARMRSHGLVREEVEQQPVGSAADVETLVPAEEGVDSVGPSLCLPNGKPISPSALPPGASRAALQKAILTQESERLDVGVYLHCCCFCFIEGGD